MFSIFSVNDPSRGFAVLFLIVVCFVVSLITPIPIPFSFFQYLTSVEAFFSSGGLYFNHMDYVAPLGMFLGSFIYSMAGRSTALFILTALPLIAYITLSFNAAISKAEILSQRSYITAFVLAVLFFLSYEFIYLQPELFALVFLVVALNLLIISTKKVNENYLSLSTGIAIGVATLFHFPSFTFLIFSILVLLLQVGISLRGVGLHFFGFLLPSGFIYVYCVLFSDFTNFLSAIQGYFFQSSYLELISINFWWFLGALTCYCLIGLIRGLFFIKLLNAQLRANWMMIFWTISALISVWITPGISMTDILFFLPAVAYFLSIEIDYTQNVFISELKTLLLVALIIFGFYLGLQSENTTFSKEQIRKNPEKKLMSLNSGLSDFLDYKRSGPYLHSEISTSTFDDLSTPESIIKVYEQFEKNLPDVVFDSSGFFEKALIKIPLLEKEYYKTGDYSWERTTKP